MIIEGTLALTGQWFLTDYMERNQILPRLGGGLPADLPGRASPRRLRHLVPAREGAGPGAPGAHRRPAGRADPPRGGGARAARADPEDYAILDYTMEETNTFAFNALSRRLKVIGIDLQQMAAAA